MISVAMTTYNGEKFIREQLESIYSQTIKPEEVVIIDDCSTDGTVEICRGFICDHNLEGVWKLIVNESNLGYEDNFKKSINLTSGDVVFLSDQDDVWVKNKIEEMSRCLVDNPDIEVLCCDLDVFYTGTNTLRWSKRDLRDMTGDGRLVKISSEGKNYQCGRSGCTMAFKRKLLEEAGDCWSDGWAQDDFLWKAAYVRQTLAILHEKLHLRRLHENNTTKITLRTRMRRIQQIERQSIECNQMVRLACRSHQAPQEVSEICSKNLQALMLRQKVVKEKNVFAALKLLISYRDCYPQLKTWMLDCYFILFNEMRSK